MKTIRVVFRTVTPLFLGGAKTDHIGQSEFVKSEVRVPPIKSALRFWFRFAEAARQCGDVGKVWQEEARLFGSAGEGTGLFRIRLRRGPSITPRASQEWSMTIGYLGYGPVGVKPGSKPAMSEPKRSFIAPGQVIEFDLIFRRDARDQDLQRIYESVWLWTHLGGFGSRARRGWGSLALEESMTGFTPQPVVAGGKDEILQQIRDGIATIVGSGQLPRDAQYTHWFADAKVCCPYVGTDGMDAMEWIARKLILFRSNSTQHKHRLLHHRPTAGDPKDFPCWADHELLRKYLVVPTLPTGAANLDYQVPPAAPLRTVFGLPQNYTFSRSTLPNNPSMASVTAAWVDARGHATELDRRSSPLLLHFHKVNQEKGSYQVAVIVTFVPAQLLPAATAAGKSLIKFSPQFDPPDRRGSRPRSHEPLDCFADPPANWTTIEQFLRSL